MAMTGVSTPLEGGAQPSILSGQLGSEEREQLELQPHSIVSMSLGA
jgi:hypothetical protein